MSRRNVKLELKVKVMRERLRLIDVKDIPRQYGVSERAADNWYQRVLEALPEILADAPPGPKPQAAPPPEAPAAPPF